MEIDDIFSQKKAQPKEQGPVEKEQNQQEPKKPENARSSKPKKNVNKEDDLFLDPKGASGRKRTEEGFLVYDEDELKMGKGGTTPLCPFDCECCKEILKVSCVLHYTNFL
ncbi:hypothetical protein SPOG_04823 [Schizosaccharomyces cryophilus OY26]|uniref:DUF1764 family protein n=1 Tax=Schizosaccharomyces cryophilus (strain OY26 / ATCC MYA-4695 / CBS 11777 / NBRC 106824 / NRRL Y48691) TaxID=653667 RepID=S9XEF3_SCHCR|nr:uncharacterized protein SPOG_04823 [Schizosaccharomyces cryophilus OY26]EPY52166.1 hypothetical protein SPOG_04823 [Schizosaccharomyces cryophilus OY26]